MFWRDAVCLTEGCVQDKQRVTREAEEVAVVRSRQLVAFNLNQVMLSTLHTSEDYLFRKRACFAPKHILPSGVCALTDSVRCCCYY